MKKIGFCVILLGWITTLLGAALDSPVLVLVGCGLFGVGTIIWTLENL